MAATGERQDAATGFPGRNVWIAGALVALGFVITIAFFDRPVAEAVARWPEAEHRFFEWLTEFGEGAIVLVPALVVWLAGLAGYWIARRYWWRWGFRSLSAMGLFVFGTVGIPGLVAAILKRLFGRARPVHLETEGVFSFALFKPFAWDFQSFPSGHATTSLAFALAVTLLFGKKALWIFVPAVLIAFSRVVIGMHFLSDVLFGAMLGLGGAWLVARYMRDRGLVFAKSNGWRNRMAPVLGRIWRVRLARRRGNG